MIWLKTHIRMGLIWAWWISSIALLWTLPSACPTHKHNIIIITSFWIPDDTQLVTLSLSENYALTCCQNLWAYHFAALLSRPNLSWNRLSLHLNRMFMFFQLLKIRVENRNITETFLLLCETASAFEAVLEGVNIIFQNLEDQIGLNDDLEDLVKIFTIFTIFTLTLV